MSPPRDFSVLEWVRDADGSPVYRLARAGIEAAELAATISRKLIHEEK